MKKVDEMNEAKEAVVEREADVEEEADVEDEEDVEEGTMLLETYKTIFITCRRKHVPKLA